MRIGVFCSGGDAPGMNACVRAVVRAACAKGDEVIGIRRGYGGILKEDFHINQSGEPLLTPACVFQWSGRGGAMLRSSRCAEFRTEEGLRQAADLLRKNRIDALVPIGGDGTLRGAIELAKYWDGLIVGCPGTIDNDLKGTDYTIGFSTAVQTAVEAVDKIRDTASSHERMFLVEVMGRHSGYIAAYTALASGSEVVAIPETETDIPEIVTYLHKLREHGRESIIMIVAEGDELGGASVLQGKLDAANCPYSTRIVILGHLQRGGVPTPEDRRRATMMGHGAVWALHEGKTGVMVGTVDDHCCQTAFEECVSGHRPIPGHVLEVLDDLWSTEQDRL